MSDQTTLSSQQETWDPVGDASFLCLDSRFESNAIKPCQNVKDKLPVRAQACKNAGAKNVCLKSIGLAAPISQLMFVLRFSFFSFQYVSRQNHMHKCASINGHSNVWVRGSASSWSPKSLCVLKCQHGLIVPQRPQIPYPVQVAAFKSYSQICDREKIIIHSRLQEPLPSRNGRIRASLHVRLGDPSQGGRERCTAGRVGFIEPTLGGQQLPQGQPHDDPLLACNAGCLA